MEWGKGGRFIARSCPWGYWAWKRLSRCFRLSYGVSVGFSKPPPPPWDWDFPSYGAHDMGEILPQVVM